MRIVRRLGVSAFAIAALAGGSPNPALAHLFRAPIGLDVGSRDFSVAIGDLNHDARPDLVTADSRSSVLEIFLSNPDGTWSRPPGSVLAGNGPRSVALADFDGDSLMDLATANSGAGTVAVCLGRGDGTFESSRSFPVGSQPYAVAALDLDGDTHLDLAVTNSGSASVSILIGNGDGTFTAAASPSTGDQPRSIAIGDMNGDGHPDLVTGNYGSSSISVLLANGNGTFQPENRVPAGSTPMSVAVADLNGDRRLDAAVANGQYSLGLASVLINQGDGAFALSPLGTTGNASAIAIGDLDGDSHPDLTVVDEWNLLVFRSLGTVDATFDFPQYYGPGYPGFALAIGDLDGDHHADVVVATAITRGRLVIFYGDSGGGYSYASRYDVGGEPRSIATGDLDGDHRSDVVVRVGGRSQVILRSNADGTLAPADTITTRGFAGRVAIVDVNADAKADLVVANASSSDTAAVVSVYLGIGDGTYTDAEDFRVGVGVYSIAAGDLDRDGHLDIVASRVSPNAVTVLLCNGDGTFQEPLTTEVAGGPTEITIADLNGDGLSDLALALRDTAAAAILLGNGDGTFALGDRYAAPLRIISVTISDLDGNTRPDLIILHGGLYAGDPGSLTAWLGNGDGTFTTAGTFPVGDSPSAVGIADLDGDGWSDAVVANVFDRCLSVLLGNGNGTFRPRSEVIIDGFLTEIAIADLNGDARSDVLVGDTSVASVWVLINTALDKTTATLLSRFEGAWTGTAVELRWGFAVSAEFSRVDVERSDASSGPWRVVDGVRTTEGSSTLQLDDAVEPGRVYYYRLAAVALDGERVWFESLAVTTGATSSGFDLAMVGPNPTSGVIQVEFVVPRPADVRLEVFDILGRRVAMLAGGWHRPGRYRVIWNGVSGGVRAPSGSYVLALVAPGFRASARVALIR